MKQKLMILLGLLLAVGLILTACGGNEETNSGDSSGDTSSDQGEQAEEALEGHGDESLKEQASVVLDMWVHQTGEAETQFYLDSIDEFNEEHAGEIYVEVAPPVIDDGSSYNDAVNAALVAGNLPDVLKLDGPFVASYAESGIIGAIDDYIKPEDKEDFVDSILEQGSFDGKLYALGGMESSVMLYYNKDIFEEEGIEAPTTVEDAWTWDEFMEVSKQLTTDDRYGLNLFWNYGIGEWMTYMGTPFVWSAGGRLLSEDGTTAEGHFNGPETVEAFEFVGNLFAEGVVSTSPGEMQFEEGKAAMALGGPWIALSAEDAGINWGMMPYPYKDEKKSPSGSMAYAITADTEYPEEAYKVVEFMTSVEKVKGLSEVTGMPPSRKSAFEEMDKYNELPYSVMREQVEQTAQARPQTPAYPVLTQAFAEAFDAVARGEDAQSALDAQISRIERELSRFAE